MKSIDRLYAERLIQLFAAFFIGLYVYFTYEAYALNIVWAGIAAALGLFGYFRPARETLAAALLAVLGFGGYTLWQLYAQSAAAGWNELIWLAALPFSALVGGLHGRRTAEKERIASELAAERKRLERQATAADEPMALDESLGLLARPAFMTRVDEALEEAAADNRTLSLMVVEIQQYWDFKDAAGFDEARLLLETTAGAIGATMPNAVAKAYMGGGAFAVLLRTTELYTAATAELSLTARHNALLLERPRRERAGRLKLKFGIAEFPLHGVDGQALYVRAAKELERTRGAL